MTARIAMVLEPAFHSKQCAQLAEDLNIPVVFRNQLESRVHDFDLVLMGKDDELGLAFPFDVDHPLHVPFFSSALRFRIRKANVKNELVLRALGHRSRESLHIVDATAGLGRDAFLFASMGHRVMMCERSPVLAAMLRFALRRLKREQHDFENRLFLYEGNALTYLATIEEGPDIVYLDPMFPVRSKTALVKKDMQVLQCLLGDEDGTDASLLLAAARRVVLGRTVVKRPRSAPFLAEKPADFTYFGKQTRFDVYTSVSDREGEKP